MYMFFVQIGRIDSSEKKQQQQQKQLERGVALLSNPQIPTQHNTTQSAAQQSAKFCSMRERKK